MKPDRTMRQIDAPMSMLHRLKKMACGIGTFIAIMAVRKAVDKPMAVSTTPVKTRIAIVAVLTAERIIATMAVRKAVNRHKAAAIKHPRPGAKYRQARTRSNKG